MTGPPYLVDRVRPQEKDQLVGVWEAAVRATHTFLTETDIQFFKPLVPKGLLGLQHLLCVRDSNGVLIAFAGVHDGKMEALFVHPSWHRAGIGRHLTTHVIAKFGVTAVDVNEQNEQAVAFYKRLGFEVAGRSEVDGMGLPFPLLHMRLRS